MSLLVDNNNYGMSSALANFYQGTAAIASWLSSLAQNAPTPAVPKAFAPLAAVAPRVAASVAQTPHNQFRSQVSATTTSASETSQTASDQPADYQQAVAAYGDS